MNFKDLKEDTQYLVCIERSYSHIGNNPVRINIEVKGNNACLLVTYNETDETFIKKWIIYNDNNYHKLIEDLTPHYRDKTITDLLKD